MRCQVGEMVCLVNMKQHDAMKMEEQLKLELNAGFHMFSLTICEE